MRFIPIALLAWAWLQESAHPLDPGLVVISPQLMKNDLYYLAGDDLEGRCAGFPGNDRATEFIASRFRAAGLKPVGDRDDRGRPTYYQHFTFRNNELKTRNCAGLLEGSDPVLKEEIVILGAHHDHVGRLGQHRAGQIGKAAPDDDLWNGADDNGSGTTALLAVVSAFGAAGVRPKRSILFMTFSAEEWGLLGSRHYVEHPLLPLEKTVTMVNMDMVGRTDEEGVAGAYALDTVAGDIYSPILERAAKRAGLDLDINRHFGGGSDHISFFNKGVPILGFSERGPCPDYHRVSDHADKIAYETMAKIARTAAHVVYDLADVEESPRRNADYKRPAPRASAKPRLGVYLQSVEGDALKALGLEPGQGALAVTGFAEGSVAQEAGLKESDIIVGFNGESFDAEQPREKLIEGLDRVIRGEPAPLVVLRDGRRTTLNITWPSTGDDAKAKALIEKLPQEGDFALEKEIADLGEDAEARVRRLPEPIRERVLSGIAVRRHADRLERNWRSRWYEVRKPDGQADGHLKLAVLRGAKEGEPLSIEAEGTHLGGYSRITSRCARDSRLTILDYVLEKNGERRASPHEHPEGKDEVNAFTVLLIAGADPSFFQGTLCDLLPQGGRPRITLRSAGPEEIVHRDQKIECRKIGIVEEHAGGRTVTKTAWVNASGVVVRVEGPEQILELSSKEAVQGRNK
ncbi:MAG: M20/M25/M40 family metallo-hydrolase [Planctomycetes bacterium]|nr:M20/M25/M40 family metallo-hydrolase [Planctomycetota bacterium]